MNSVGHFTKRTEIGEMRLDAKAGEAFAYKGDEQKMDFYSRSAGRFFYLFRLRAHRGWTAAARYAAGEGFPRGAL